MRTTTVVSRSLALLFPALMHSGCLAGADDPTYRPLGLARTWAIGGEGRWDYASLDADGSHLFVTRSTHMQVISTATGTVAIDVAGCKGAHGVALAPANGRMFISDGGSGSVGIAELATGKVLGAIAAADDADCIIADPASQQILTFCGDAGVMVPLAMGVDAVAGKAGAPLDLKGKPEFAAADGAGLVFNAIVDKDEVVVIDTKANAITARYPTAPGKSPTGIAVDAARHRLFIGCRNQVLIVMDATTGKVLAQDPIGRGNDATAYNAGLAYASCGDGTLTVVKADGNDFPVLQVAKTAPGARTMAVAPDGTVYLPCADMAPPAADQPKQRPQPIPGSFKILVMAPGATGGDASATGAATATGAAR